MTHKQTPNNAIDNFFFKISQGITNTIKTIKESKIINKTIVNPLTKGPIAIILWYIILTGIVGIIATLTN